MEGSPFQFVCTPHPCSPSHMYLSLGPSPTQIEIPQSIWTPLFLAICTSLPLHALLIHECPQHLCASLLPSPNCKSLPLDSLHPTMHALYLYAPLISHTYPKITSLVKDPYAPLRAMRVPHGGHTPIIRSFVRDFCAILRSIRTTSHTLLS